MYLDQHVSENAWRFQNNPFQLVHSRAVTSIFGCCWSFLVLWLTQEPVQAALRTPS